MSRRDFTIPSKDGVHRLHVVLWEPEDRQSVKGVVQISHGMIEMVSRYDCFARYLNKHGYAVIGNDHLGHGLSAGNNSDLGYFCPDNISATVVADLCRVTKLAKKRYRGKPLILFGHSMGSFMARRYVMTYPYEADMAIICGTGNQRWTRVILGSMVAFIEKHTLGDRYRSKFIRQSSFAGYLSRIKNPRTPNDWLTRDEKIVDWYNAQKFCSFDFTVNGYRGLFDVLGFIKRKKNINRISKELPILFIAGKEDPVGKYGRDVEKIYGQYKKAGVVDIAIKLYQNDRHEILNELDRLNVYEDILRWIDERVTR